ncbi:transposase [Actinospica durhamensis]|uniref:Transposase n=1 Tax=Actinospica durhamensis TaxID=1508375 RepID=A0A941EJF2_9ACTN|nr:transposase [Actinospica durhamensis]
MPERYGPWSTVAGRFRVWARQGVFQRLMDGLIAEAATSSPHSPPPTWPREGSCRQPRRGAETEWLTVFVEHAQAVDVLLAEVPSTAVRHARRMEASKLNQ